MNGFLWVKWWWTFMRYIHTYTCTHQYTHQNSPTLANKCCRLNLIAMMKSTGEKKKKKNTRWNKENVEKKKEKIYKTPHIASELFLLLLFLLVSLSLSVLFHKLNSKHSKHMLSYNKMEFAIFIFAAKRCQLINNQFIFIGLFLLLLNVWCVMCDMWTSLSIVPECRCMSANIIVVCRLNSLYVLVFCHFPARPFAEDLKQFRGILLLHLRLRISILKQKEKNVKFFMRF